MAGSSGRSTAELSAELWELAWAGRATNTAFAALRQGIETGFEAAAAQQSASSGAARSRPRSAPRFGRRSGDRWRASRSFVGQWEALPTAEEPPDALEAEELAKDRARQLLTRYGIVFRELLGRELPALQWSKVFRALRLMELSGEVLAGRFFTDIPGLQFIAPGAFRELRGGLSEDAVYGLAAPDPASLGGPVTVHE